MTNPCAAGSGNVWVNGDIRIEYTQPSGVLTNDTRDGYYVTVTLTYRQNVIVPLIGALLSTDANGRFVHVATVTMVNG